MNRSLRVIMCCGTVMNRSYERYRIVPKENFIYTIDALVHLLYSPFEGIYHNNEHFIQKETENIGASTTSKHGLARRRIVAHFFVYANVGHINGFSTL